MHLKDSFIKSLKIPKKMNIGIMVNASDLSSLNFKRRKGVNFRKKKNKKLN